MLRISQSVIETVRNASQPSDLFSVIQKAIELEHSTIPPYLTALFSIKSGTNRDIYRSIRNIVRDEMLHFAIGCNLLNALGGKPRIFDPAFVTNYPTHLPLNINSTLIVGLEKLSIKQLEEVFMEIEEPEHPIVFPENLAFSLEKKQPGFATIGLFYASLKDKIADLGIDVLPGDPNLQVTSVFYGEKELFPILTAKDAISAIDVIVQQGEGTTQAPKDQFGDLAHYYRFKEIAVGRKLVDDPSVPEGFSYSGDDIEFDENSIFPIYPNTKLKMLAEGSAERLKAEEFASKYTSLLKDLHSVFNGSPANIDGTIDTMVDLSMIAAECVEMEFPDYPGSKIGPPFEFFV